MNAATTNSRSVPTRLTRLWWHALLAALGPAIFTLGVAKGS
jgi:hypothetical protein